VAFLVGVAAAAKRNRTPMDDRRTAMISPCIQALRHRHDARALRRLRPDAGQIGGWMAFSDAERPAIMADLPARLAASRRRHGAVSTEPGSDGQTARRASCPGSS
jgi:predicted Fe-S protein YdhL (DUF1289 family)